MRALKWMLVSKRPLRPEELVAAAELNPAIAVGSCALSQESTLEVELLIQSCGGLLLLDTTLNVVRFSHLSVQEYLETRSETWDVSVIDAQLFVSESCLWTLQSSLELPLYNYAALNWFQHCRSYQDLVLWVRSQKDTERELRIPLLNSFLGSFKEASASYAKWADWVGANVGIYDSLLCVRSTPLYPAFAAAFAGLGQVVSWLWDSEGNDMKIQNDRRDSLLQVAIGEGTEWIVVEMLKSGLETNDVQNGLYPASRSGKSGIIKLLLDRGADVNFPGGGYGSALGAAACWGRVETVALLLDRGADVNIPGGGYGSALGAAACWGSVETVALLLDRGADVNVPSGRYGSALVAAASGGKVEIVALLLDRGADVNIPSGGYGSALGAAACWGSVETVALLLDRGADVNIPGGDYGSALGAAAYGGKVETVALLLDRGADVNIPGGGYGSALGAAASGGGLEVAKLLFHHGANPDLTTNEGARPRDLAEQEGNQDIVDLLDSMCGAGELNGSADNACST